MTWAEFKQQVENQNIHDDTNIGSINISKDKPVVVIVDPAHPEAEVVIQSGS